MDSQPPDVLTRRAALQGIAAASVLLAALSRSSAWAGGRPAALDSWARVLIGLNGDLAQRRIDVLQWQDRVTALNSSVGLSELVAYIDIDRLTREFRYPTLLAETADPVLPPEVLDPASRKQWFIRVFGMRRGGAIIPHVHNNMVSAHLVVSGSFHARTHDRVDDVPDAVLLRPRLDGLLKTGQSISMSDRRDNQHWLVAQEDRSMTFDVGVTGLGASFAYGHKAGSYNMIFVDAGRRPERDGMIVAPVMTFEQCAAKYAA